MNAKARIAKLERITKVVERHTCGPIILVDLDEEVPAEIPRCAICDREGNIRIIQICRAPPRAEENEAAP